MLTVCFNDYGKSIEVQKEGKAEGIWGICKALAPSVGCRDIFAQQLPRQ
jgi:hypothetical protein